jgi:acetolactate synthase-1/2/3 large subunit
LQIITPEELIQGLDAAFASDLPIFVDVATAPEVENLPPVFSWLKAANAK